MSEPHYWTTRDGWYVWETVGGKRRRRFLAKTKRAAYDVWKAAIKAGESIRRGDPQFSVIAGQWLERQYQRLERGEVSHDWISRVVRTVQRFDAANPGITCSNVTPAVARSWLPKGSSASYERTEINVLKQILKWGVEEAKLISSSNLVGIKLDKGGRREAILTIEQHRTLARPTFVWSKEAKAKRRKWKPDRSSLRILLWFCWWTGARPGELRELRWEQIADDCATATLREHKTAKHGKVRTLYFNSRARKLLQRFRQSTGPVFTTSQGNAWSKGELGRQLRTLCKREGIKATAYAYRHSFITRALIEGHNLATVAEFTGTSVDMIARHYGHLDKAKPHLAALADALG